MRRVVAILLLFGRLWTRFCFLIGRGHDFAFRYQKSWRHQDVESWCRPFQLTTVILMTDSQCLGIEVVRLPLGDSELYSDLLV